MNPQTLQRICVAARATLLVAPEASRPAILAQLARVERTANTVDGTFEADLKIAAKAFEHDMQPVCNATAEALKAGGLAPLADLRIRLPKLLMKINSSPELAVVLIKLLGRELVDGLQGKPTATANASETLALQQWRSRSIFPTDFSSKDIQGLSRELRMRSVFSARMTNAEAVKELAQVVDDMLAGKIELAEGRWRMMRKLKSLGYDPEKGFPGEMGVVPPAERGSLRDLSSARRIDLMLETNMRIAANYGRMVAGNSPHALRAYPAWELFRLYIRRVPRGSEESHTDGWSLRWNAAGQAVEWEGVDERAMIARKDSPLWPALGDGAGGYKDTLGNPFPPFAFNSGWAWREVSREECVKLGLIQGEETSEPMEGQLTPGQQEVKSALERLGAEFQKGLLEELGEIAA